MRVNSGPAIATKRAFRFQELGLVVVILVLGALLTIFGGNVKVPVLKKNAQGEWERVLSRMRRANRKLRSKR